MTLLEGGGGNTVGSEVRSRGRIKLAKWRRLRQITVRRYFKGIRGSNVPFVGQLRPDSFRQIISQELSASSGFVLREIFVASHREEPDRGQQHHRQHNHQALP